MSEHMEICNCGHAREWHAPDDGFCLCALDIDEECPCRAYDSRYSLLLLGASSSHLQSSTGGGR